MSFGFSTATEILFGPGCVKNAFAAAKAHGALGNKAMLVCNDLSRAKAIVDELKRAGIPFIHQTVAREPCTELVDKAAQSAREEKVDFVIAVGGGSVMDTGKAIAMLVANGGECLDYLEVVGRGKKITKKSLPLIAVATTAGTGAEVTKNAVVKSVQHAQKASLRSPSMFPVLAVVDPLLMLSVPPQATACSGLDAFTQCLEPLTSNAANPLTDTLALRGLREAASSLRVAYADGANVKARTGIALCSLMGGLCLANAKLGSVHGFAGVLGGMLESAPHGGICGALIPACIVANIQAMRQRDPSNPALQKYHQAAQAVLGKADATPEQLALWVAESCRIMKVPPLSAYGLKPEHFPEAVSKSAAASSMKGNPIVLTEKELTSILEQACTPALVAAKL